jgi:acetyl-CoA acyltransferase
MSEAFLCDAVRTPFGRYGGALSGVRADELGVAPIKALLARNPSLDGKAVDDVILGCANQAGEDNRNVARMAALLAGLPADVPGVTVNRLCGSGMEAVVQAARAIRCGEASLVVAGGVESMSRAPFVLSKAAGPFARDLEMADSTLGWRFINPRMRELYGVDSMPETAENVAAEYKISRCDQDVYALRSQLRAAEAIADGRLAQEIVPVTVPRAKGEPSVIRRDEQPRPDTTAEGLARLKGLVRDTSTVTAGNSTGLNDGACAVILASEEAAERYHLTPRARIVSTDVAGVPPRVMGIGPLPASRRALVRAGLEIGAMDTIEVNEAFAAQVLAVLRGLGVPDDAPHVNPNGGAIALGHPLGASGARLVATAMYELARTGGRYALCTMCIGVGQGIAVVIERA